MSKRKGRDNHGVKRGGKPPKLPELSESARNYLASRGKNISDTIPVGTTVQTRDNYFYGSSDFIKRGKTGSALTNNYRRAVVIDTNGLDELALVKLTQSKDSRLLKHYRGGESGYKSFVEVYDDKRKPIKGGKKFVRNPSWRDVPQNDVDRILIDCVTDQSTSDENLRRLRKLKKRKKNPPDK
jgi:hypothetical protein